MIRSKVFTARSASRLEKKINDWLASHPHAQPETAAQSSATRRVMQGKRVTTRNLIHHTLYYELNAR